MDGSPSQTGQFEDEKNLLPLCGNTAYMQGDSWIVDITVRDDFPGLCDQKISYKHMSNFEWLWSLTPWNSE
jgi:hypothetical protein